MRRVGHFPGGCGFGEAFYTEVMVSPVLVLEVKLSHIVAAPGVIAHSTLGACQGSLAAPGHAAVLTLRSC